MVGVTGVGVIDGVTVKVIVGVTVGSTTWPDRLRAKYTRPAPIARKRVKKPNTAGKVKVSSGIRLPWIGLDLPGDFILADRSVPHTRHRAASILNRVPQVGHVFVGFEIVSGLILLF